MFTLNRSDARSLHDQLVEQIRYLVASGRLRPGEPLPSTRHLAERLDISFHTVRKAYAALAAEGVVSSRAGSAYRINESDERPKGERLETGAAVVQETIRRLVSLGLDDDEISYLFEEQIELSATDDQHTRLVFVDEYTEGAEFMAAEFSRSFGLNVDSSTLAQVAGLNGIDYALTPFRLVKPVMELISGGDVIGVQTGLAAEACSAVARLFDHQTLLLVVRFSDAVGPLSRQLCAETGFGGQIIAIAVDEPDSGIGALVRQSDVFLYTHASTRRARAHLGSSGIHHELNPGVSRTEIDRIRMLLPG